MKLRMMSLCVGVGFLICTSGTLAEKDNGHVKGKYDALERKLKSALKEATRLQVREGEEIRKCVYSFVSVAVFLAGVLVGKGTDHQAAIVARGVAGLGVVGSFASAIYFAIERDLMHHKRYHQLQDKLVQLDEQCAQAVDDLERNKESLSTVDAVALSKLVEHKKHLTALKEEFDFYWDAPCKVAIPVIVL